MSQTINKDELKKTIVFNVKSIEDYIGRIDEMIERKRQGLPQGGKL